MPHGRPADADEMITPASLRTDFSALLDVKFWLMGRDVEHPSGNLLCRFGFTRESASHRVGPSRYMWTQGERVIVLWPCGMLFSAGESGCLLLRGHTPLRPGRAGLADMLDPREMLDEQEHATSSPIEALVSASRWFAGYECFLVRAAGVGRRIPRRDSAPSLAPPRPCSLGAAWGEMARRAHISSRAAR